jgi:two-component system NarL family response regulator
VKLRVLLVDDHRMFREALRAMLERMPDIEVVGEAGDGLEALELAEQTRPHVVCMDVRMPGLNGVEATRRLLAAQPAARVIGLSSYSDSHLIQEMLNAGATGYVTKDEAGVDLLRAIRAGAAAT